MTHSPTPESLLPEGSLKSDAVRRFVRLGLLTALVYALCWAFYSYDPLSNARVPREYFTWFLTLSLLALYWRGYLALKQTDGQVTRQVAGFGVLLALLAFGIENFHSTDVFGYINRGWQQVHYHLNPYVYTVNDTPGWQQDPMIVDHWVNNPSPYGFLYLLIARGLTWLGQGNHAVTVLVFKASNVLLHAAMAGLVWLAARRAHLARPDLALYLYAWSPLMLIHGISNGHNDMWMGFFILLATIAALAGRWVWILPALVAGTLVKYAAVVILPLAVLFLIRQKAWKALLLGGFLGLVVFGLAGSPFLGDWQAFKLSEINKNAFVSHASLHSFLYNIYKLIARTWSEFAGYKPVVRAVLKNLLLAGYGAFYLWNAWQLLRTPKPQARQFIERALLAVAVLVCLVSLKFYAWYLGMFLALAMLLPEAHWLRRAVILISAFQLFSLTFVGQAHFLNFLVMLALPLLVLLWQEKRRRVAGPQVPEAIFAGADGQGEAHVAG